MDINNITNLLNDKVNSADSTGKSQNTPETSISKSNGSIADKVSLGEYNTNKSEELFAKIELEKLNQSSFDKLKSMKAQISEYEAAKEISHDAANETKIGQLINDPNVWSQIATRIIG